MNCLRLRCFRLFCAGRSTARVSGSKKSKPKPSEAGSVWRGGAAARARGIVFHVVYLRFLLFGKLYHKYLYISRKALPGKQAAATFSAEPGYATFYNFIK